MQTWYQYMMTLPPSKLGIFLRKKLAHNQGCPPAPLMWIFTMCGEASSCDDCWWVWLNSERDESLDDDAEMIPVHRCWNCRWGARGEQGGNPFVACMNKRFYGAIMSPDDYCSDNCERYWEGKANGVAKLAASVALKADLITEENAEEIGKELKRRYELKQIQREIERRKQGGDNETSSEREEDHEPEPDPGEGPDRIGDS